MLWQVRRGLITGRGALDAAAGGGGLGLQTNLSAFFSLDDLTDATGTVTDLTNNATATFVAGKVGNCVNVTSASSQYLSHASVAALQVGSGDFSISFWFNATTLSNALAGKTGAFGNSEFLFNIQFVSSNIVRFTCYRSDGGTVSVDASSFGALSTSTWYHVVGTYNATTREMLVYVNTVSNSGTLTAAMGAKTSDFNIGASNGTSFFNGKIDQFGIWKNRILSAGDVTALYNSGAGLSYAAMA